MKKVLAFVLTFGFVIALTSTVGCSKKDEPVKADSTKDTAKPKAEANK